MRSETEGFIFRDVGLAAVIGPLRLLLPALGYLALYRVVLERSGLQVLGLWSLLSTLSIYLTLADAGFSQVIAREVGRDLGEEERLHVAKDYVAARRVYVFAGFGLTVVAAAAGLVLTLTASSTVYPIAGIGVALPLIVVAAVTLLLSRLDAAVLSALNDNAFVQTVFAITPLALFTIAVFASFLRHPIEGFAFGSLVTAVIQVRVFRYRLRRGHVRWAADPTLSWSETRHRIVRLARRGGFLYAASLGFIAREPIFRLIVALFTGLVGVGIYDIALRATTMLREMAAAGLTALYPAFAYFHRVNTREPAVELLRIALLLLVGTGALLLGAILAFPASILGIWLPEVPYGLESAVRLLAIWQLLTLANVPYWMLLQSTGHERVAAVSLWLHTGAVLVLLPLSLVLRLQLVELLVYWLVAAAFTQAMIYSAAHRRLNLVLPVIRDQRVAALLGVVLAGTTVLAFLPVPNYALGFVYGLLLVSVVALVGQPVRTFIIRARASVSEVAFDGASTVTGAWTPVQNPIAPLSTPVLPATRR